MIAGSGSKERCWKTEGGLTSFDVDLLQGSAENCDRG